jgi:hypothetical protein
MAFKACSESFRLWNLYRVGRGPRPQTSKKGSARLKSRQSPVSNRFRGSQLTLPSLLCLAPSPPHVRACVCASRVTHTCACVPVRVRVCALFYTYILILKYKKNINIYILDFYFYKHHRYLYTWYTMI